MEISPEKVLESNSNGRETELVELAIDPSKQCSSLDRNFCTNKELRKVEISFKFKEISFKSSCASEMSSFLTTLTFPLHGEGSREDYF